MQKGNAQGKGPRKTIGPLKTTLWLLFEVTIYAAFVVAYGWLVLLLLRGWLAEMFQAHTILYAALVLPLIITQAVLLDLVTIGLRKLGRGTPKS